MHRAFIEPRIGGIQAEDRDDETRIASTLRQPLDEPQHALAAAAPLVLMPMAGSSES